jgi:hypothetical protein
VKFDVIFTLQPGCQIRPAIKSKLPADGHNVTYNKFQFRNNFQSFLHLLTEAKIYASMPAKRFLDAPNANNDRTSRSIETEGSPDFIGRKIQELLNITYLKSFRFKTFSFCAIHTYFLLNFFLLNFHIS